MPRPIIADLIACQAVRRCLAAQRAKRAAARQRWIFAPAAALLIALLTGASGAAAQTSTGQGAPETRAQLEAEYNQAFEQMLKNPADLDITFRFAELASELGNNEAAISALERMLLFNPDLPRVRFELGVLYFRLGSYDVARSYFTQARNAPDTPTDVRQRIDAFLVELNRRASPHQLSGSLLSGFRYQSNADAGPGPNVLAQGNAFTLQSRFVKRADWNYFITGNARHTYDLGTQNNALIETNGLAYDAEQFKVSTVDLAIFEGNTGPRFDVTSDDEVLVNVRPYALANDVLLDHTQYFYTLGGGLELSRAITDRLAGDLTYEYRRKRFANSSNQPQAALLDSQLHSVLFDLRYALLDNGIVDGGASFSREAARTDFNSNRELDFRLAYTQSFPLPYAIPEGPLVLIPAIFRIYTTYDAPDPAIDPNKRRVDQQWRYAFTAQLGLYKGFAANLQFIRQVNGSSLPNFKFNDTSIAMGLLWSF